MAVEGFTSAIARPPSHGFAVTAPLFRGERAQKAMAFLAHHVRTDRGHDCQWQSSMTDRIEDENEGEKAKVGAKQ